MPPASCASSVPPIGLSAADSSDVGRSRVDLRPLPRIPDLQNVLGMGPLSTGLAFVPLGALVAGAGAHTLQGTSPKTSTASAARSPERSG